MITTLLRHLDPSRFECHLGVVGTGNSFLEGVPGSVMVHHLGAARMRYAMPGIVKLARRLKPQTILSTVVYLNVVLIMAKPFFSGRPRILLREAVLPSAYIAQVLRPTRLWKWLYSHLYPRADQIICLFDGMVNDMVEHLGIPRGKLVRIYNPVDIEMVRRQAEGTESPYTGPGPNLVAMGRLQHQKAYDVLLHAFAGVRKSVPGARLTILGEGPLEQQLKEQAVSLGLDNAVSFLGFQANPWPYVKHADLFVLASRYEGLPNAVLEVLALGTPVVATDCPGGIREIQKSAPQIALVPPDNPGALTEAIVSILSRPKETCGKQTEAEECLRRFDTQQIVDEYARLL
ncbi:MAG: glycosyltransferase [Acidobacteriia bacterium]|nr:glycosyltransferase [Terriglobia bacterium]